MAGDSDAFEFVIRKIRDPDSADDSQIGQIRSLVEEVIDDRIVDDFFPGLKESIDAPGGAPGLLTNQEIQGILYESIRRQRDKNQGVLYIPDSQIGEVLERARLMALREADRRKLAGPKLPPPFIALPPPPVRTPPPSSRGPLGVRSTLTGPLRDGDLPPPISRRALPSVHRAPSTLPPPRLPSARRRTLTPTPTHHIEGLYVLFRALIAPLGGGSPARPDADGAPLPRPDVRITRASRGGGAGTPEAFEVTVEIMPPPVELSDETHIDLMERLKPVILDNAKDLAAAVRQKLRQSPSPSQPGSPPGVDSGKLANSIEMTIGGDGLEALVGSNSGYARHLEFGTMNMAARPFMLATFEAAKGRFEQQVRSAANGALAALHNKLSALEKDRDQAA